MVRSRTALMLLLAWAVAACDASPSDPLDPRTDLAALLQGGAEAGAVGLSLPGLVHAAVHRVYTEHGAAAARALVVELRRAQELDGPGANGSGDEAAAKRPGATRAEELRIVLHVFGPAVTRRVIDAVQADAYAMEAALREAEARGIAPAGGHDALRRIMDGLAAAQDAVGRDDPAALDMATRAAAAADALRRSLAAADRLADLDDLFAAAAQRMQTVMGADAARDALAAYDRMRRDSEQVVRGGNPQRAHVALKAVRDEQVRFVLAVLGDGAVQRLLADAAVAGDELAARIAADRARGLDVSRLERMNATASDMLTRSALVLADGDAATALDLASHAAGLINAARLDLSP